MLAAIYPELKGLSGHFGGTLRIEPASDSRALEPLRLHLIVDSYEGGFQGAQIGDATLTAFLITSAIPTASLTIASS